MFKELTMQEWVQKREALSQDEADKLYNGTSPGGVAAALGVSRQAVHDAINRDRIDAWRLVDDHGRLLSILIPNEAVDHYRRHYLKRSA